MTRADWQWVAMLCLAFAANVVLWGLLYPFNAVPDEHVRLYMIEFLEQFGQLPSIPPATSSPFIGTTTGIRYTGLEWWYFGLPNIDVYGAWSTTHLFSGLFPAGEAFRSARLFNWLLSLVFAVSMSAISVRVAANRIIGVLCAAIVLAIPQITFIFSYVNSDALALTLCALLLLAALRLVEKRSAWRAGQFGMVAGLLICTKLYYAPAVAAALVVTGLGLHRSSRFTWSDMTRASLIAALSFCAVTLPILLSTYSMYGEAFGMNGQAEFVARHWDDPLLRRDWCALFCRGDLVNGPELRWWTAAMFRSFFFAGGWMSIWFEDHVYQLIFTPLLLVIAAVSLFYVVRRLSALKTEDRQAIWGVGLIVIFWGLLASTTIMNLLGQQQLAPQPQGRYLFAVVPFLAAMLGVACSNWERGSTSGAATGEAARRFCLGVILVALTWSNAQAYLISADSPQLVTKPPSPWDRPVPARLRP